MERSEDDHLLALLANIEDPCPRNLVFLDFAPTVSPNPIPSFKFLGLYA